MNEFIKKEISENPQKSRKCKLKNLRVSILKPKTMRNLFFALILLFSTTVIANAQIVVGGSIGFNSSGGSIDANGHTSDKNNVSNFTFSPMVGYFFSENFLAGVELGVTSSRNENPSASTTTTTSSFGLTPYARYYAFRMNKFSIFGQAELGLSFGKEKTKIGSTTNDGPKTSTFSLMVFPGIAYDISDRLELQAAIGGLNVGFSNVVKKQDNYTDRSSYFGMGVNLNNIATTGAINIGAIFKF